MLVLYTDASKIQSVRYSKHIMPPYNLNHSSNFSENFLKFLLWVPLFNITVGFIQFSPLFEDMGVTYRILDLSNDLSRDHSMLGKGWK
jgi:hypothetical protein